MKPIQLGAIVAAVTFAICGPVFAQTAVVAAKEGVNFTPVANNVIAVAVAALTVAAGVVSKFAVSFLASKTKLSDSQFEEGLARRLNDVLLRAIDHAEMWAKQQVADNNSSINDVRIDNLFMRIAVEYAVNSAPGIIRYFGFTPERIETMIKSRLNAYVLSPETNSGKVALQPASPVTLSSFPPPA